MRDDGESRGSSEGRQTKGYEKVEDGVGGRHARRSEKMQDKAEGRQARGSETKQAGLDG